MSQTAAGRLRQERHQQPPGPRRAAVALPGHHRAHRRRDAVRGRRRHPARSLRRPPRPEARRRRGDGHLAARGISIPIFVLGYTLQYIFAVQLHWLPASGPDRSADRRRVPDELHPDRLAPDRSTSRRSGTGSATSSCRPSRWARSRSRSSPGSPAPPSSTSPTRTTSARRAPRASPRSGSTRATSCATPGCRS